MTTPLAALNASVDYSDPGDPTFKLTYSDVSAAANWDTVPDENDDQNLEPWILGIIRMLELYSVNVNNPASNVVVNFAGKGLSQRNALEKVSYSYSVTFYQPDTTPATPDGDDF